MRKEHKNPKGGLTAKGRAYFKRKEGSNLKPPVKRGVNPRRISFAARFAGMKGKEKDEKGRKIINEITKDQRRTFWCPAIQKI